MDIEKLLNTCVSIKFQMTFSVSFGKTRLKFLKTLKSSKDNARVNIVKDRTCLCYFERSDSPD